MNTEKATETAPQWEEPLTGPGVTIRDGYDFEFIVRPLRRLFSKGSK